jgi:hypothetical protein
VKSQVSQRFGEYCQVAESGVTEPGLKAGSHVAATGVASVVNCVTVAVWAGADGAIVEALIEDRECLPVGTAVVQVALGAVKGCQFPVDPPERYRVGCVAAEDLLGGIQGGGIGESAGRAEEVVYDDGVMCVGLLAQGRPHVDGGSGPGDLHDGGHLAAGGASEACRGCLPDPLPEPGRSRYRYLTCLAAARSLRTPVCADVVLRFPGGCRLVLFPELAHVVHIQLNGAGVEYAVAIVGAFPHARGGQLCGEGRRLGTETTQWPTGPRQ